MRFFLDNCLAIRHARALEEMVKPEHSFTHLQDKFKPSTKDEEWILGLGEEGNWIVISGDYRIGKNAHERAAWHQKVGLPFSFSTKVGQIFRLCSNTQSSRSSLITSFKKQGLPSKERGL
jgi:hypothetical protein